MRNLDDCARQIRESRRLRSRELRRPKKRTFSALAVLFAVSCPEFCSVVTCRKAHSITR